MSNVLVSLLLAGSTDESDKTADPSAPAIRVEELHQIA